MTVFSSSWDDGGFDPILAIWDANTRALLSQQDDGHNTGSTLSNGVLYDHGTWDSYYTVNLGDGNYIATIAEYNNFAAGANLSDGFIPDGDPHFTFTQGWGPQPDFNGVSSIPNDPRTGDYVYHILGVESAVIVPPPRSGVPDGGSSLILVGLSLAGLAGVRRLRK